MALSRAHTPSKVTQIVTVSKRRVNILSVTDHAL